MTKERQSPALEIKVACRLWSRAAVKGEQRGLARGFLCVLGVVVCAVSGCSDAAPNSDASLNRLAQLRVVSETPIDGQRLALAKDPGSDSSINGRDPSVTAAFATSMSVQQAALYYRRRFPEYGFAIECCASTSAVSEIGGRGFASVRVSIGLALSGVNSLKGVHVAKPTAGRATYIAVFATGDAT